MTSERTLPALEAAHIHRYQLEPLLQPHPLELLLKSDYYFPLPLALEQLTAEAMRLPVESRVLLADRLVESLDSVDGDEIQRRWTVEALLWRTIQGESNGNPTRDS